MAIQEEYTRQILDKVRKLPPEKVVEVLDFVLFIEDQENMRTREDALDVSDEEFEVLLSDCFGRWTNEVDGVTYTNKLRSNWQDRYRGIH